MRMCLFLTVLTCLTAPAGGQDLRRQAQEAAKNATRFFTTKASRHGGYVYHYLPDLSRQWGEGEATKDQVWVQPPGTPTVGMALLTAWRATGDNDYLKAARAAAEALAYGQLKSGGWTNCIDFDPQGARTAAYRNGRGRGKNNSSLDDGQTPSAIRFLVQADEALEFESRQIHLAAESGLNALLAAQFANGGFPQVWTGPVPDRPVRRARFPNHDWRTEGRIKNYWDMYTLNDNVCGYVAETLIEAHRVYGGTRYRKALEQLGDFLILAQMPQPQPGWAQQYNQNMEPIWARRFEPPGVSGDETQEAIQTLLTIFDATGDDRFLKPIPEALKWLRRSKLPDGQVARYYELRTNRALYMSRSGRNYTLTYDDSRLPKHYGWKTPCLADELQAAYDQRRNTNTKNRAAESVSEKEVRRIIADLDEQDRWLSTFRAGDRVVGQMKLPDGSRYLSSAVFSRNLETLSRFIAEQR